MKAAVVIALTMIAGAQTINPSPQSLIRQSRRLLPAEVVQILEASRKALAGQRFRVAFVAGGPGFDVVAGPDARPLWVHSTHGESRSSGHVDVITIREYIDTPAQSCDGKRLGGNLVVEYEHRTPPGTWTAKPRTRSDTEELWPLFDTIADDALTSGDVGMVNGHNARAFTAPWKMLSKPGVLTSAPAATREVLWIDVDTLLPLRWAVSLPPQANAPANPDYGLSFTYDGTIDIRAPDGVTPPTCIK
jgi:hypothetical protein